MNESVYLRGRTVKSVDKLKRTTDIEPIATPSNISEKAVHMVSSPKDTNPTFLKGTKLRRTVSETNPKAKDAEGKGPSKDELEQERELREEKVAGIFKEARKGRGRPSVVLQ